jgi:hypothetical protein
MGAREKSSSDRYAFERPSAHDVRVPLHTPAVLKPADLKDLEQKYGNRVVLTLAAHRLEQVKQNEPINPQEPVEVIVEGPVAAYNTTASSSQEPQR